MELEEAPADKKNRKRHAGDDTPSSKSQRPSTAAAASEIPIYTIEIVTGGRFRTPGEVEYRIVWENQATSGRAEWCQRLDKYDFRDPQYLQRSIWLEKEETGGLARVKSERVGSAYSGHKIWLATGKECLIDLEQCILDGKPCEWFLADEKFASCFTDRSLVVSEHGKIQRVIHDWGGGDSFPATKDCFAVFRYLMSLNPPFKEKARVVEAYIQKPTRAQETIAQQVALDVRNHFLPNSLSHDVFSVLGSASVKDMNAAHKN